MTEEHGRQTPQKEPDYTVGVATFVGFGLVFAIWQFTAIYRAWGFVPDLQNQSETIHQLFAVMASDLSPFVEAISSLENEPNFVANVALLSMIAAPLFVFYKIGRAMEWLDSQKKREGDIENAE